MSVVPDGRLVAVDAGGSDLPLSPGLRRRSGPVGVTPAARFVVLARASGYPWPVPRKTYSSVARNCAMTSCCVTPLFSVIHQPGRPPGSLWRFRKSR